VAKATMTLRIIAAEEQLRVLKLSVQTLSKFGHEIVFEARPNGIHLRSVNQSKSAYVRITFNSSFFDVYELFEQPVLSAGILAKCLVASLRTQRICRAIFEVFTQENRLVVYVDCENGLQKKFQFDLIDSEALQAEINFDMYPVRITVEAGEMNRLLASFQQSLDEVTLIAIPDSGAEHHGDHQGNGGRNHSATGTDKSCQIHSFYDPSKVDLGNSLLHTQLSLNAHQHFLEYQHTGRETVDVTFNLKDFKAVLTYCLSTRNNLGILFSRAGEPLAILPMPMHEHMNSEFTSEFVLATMLDSTVDSNTGKPSPMVFQPATANAANGSRGGGGASTHNHSTLARELEKRNRQQQQQQQQQQQRPRPIRDAMTPQGSDMDTNEVAKHLVAMNHHPMSGGSHNHSHPQPMSTSTTGSVRAVGGGGGAASMQEQQQQKQPPNMRRTDEEQRKKRPRASQETDTLVSGSTLSLRHSAVEEAEVQRKEDSDSDSEEVPGTPTHERRVDTWVENWSVQH